MAKTGNITTEMKHVHITLTTKLFLIVFLFSTSSFVSINTFSQAQIVSNDLRKHKLILINPGHGGHDSGAIGSSGLSEKDLTLTLAKRVVIFS
ncbi:MAG: N-acetylmuramoyl-L-alanine amidase [Deltaproteobacteria bacterium]|nr:N-acetylmuramoyl-L-alanine amidase [Deltaproteobacteria bacterium]